MMKKPIIYGVLVLTFFSIILISGCVDDILLRYITENKTDVVEIKAPGCEGSGFIPTGCLGKSIIRDIKVEPATECLKLHTKNCNGAVLIIENECHVDLNIGGETIYAGSSKIIEFVRNKEGKIFVIEQPGIVESYNPEEEDLLIVEGLLGDKEVTISYVKKNVCGTVKIPNIGVFLKMYKNGFGADEEVKAYIEGERMLFAGFPAFEVYQLVDGEGVWQQIDIYGLGCALPCSVDEADICTELPIACAPLPEYCQDFNPLSDEFRWDQMVYKTRDIECPDLNETRSCSFIEKAEPGTYKLVFQYSENCVNEDFFYAEENNIQKIEKRFKLEG